MLVFVGEKDGLPGHVFISYVRENAREVDNLQKMLELAGIKVWRDKADLWPGDHWRRVIRQAITQDALVFVACFSQESTARRKSYQNEELRLAVDEMRLRPQGEPWLIPVRLSDCEIPDDDIGGGNTLRSIHWVDLFGEDAEASMARLAEAVRRILVRHQDKPARSAQPVTAAGVTAGPGRPALSADRIRAKDQSPAALESAHATHEGAVPQHNRLRLRGRDASSPVPHGRPGLSQAPGMQAVRAYPPGGSAGIGQRPAVEAVDGLTPIRVRERRSVLALIPGSTFGWLTVLIMGVGGALYPPIWLVGGGMTIGARNWERREKLIAVVVPILLAVIGACYAVVIGGQRVSLGSYAWEMWLAGERLSRLGAVISALFLSWRLARPQRGSPSRNPWRIERGRPS